MIKGGRVKIVKIRKPHKCSYCDRERPIGTMMEFGEHRGPKFDNDHETQIGIEYCKWYLCYDDKECAQHN